MSYVQPVYLQGGTPGSSSPPVGASVTAPAPEPAAYSVSDTVNDTTHSMAGDVTSIAAAASK